MTKGRALFENESNDEGNVSNSWLSIAIKLFLAPKNVLYIYIYILKIEVSNTFENIHEPKLLQRITGADYF